MVLNRKFLKVIRINGKFLKAIRIDSGKEFVNETLKVWCHQNGIKIQMTAPYSPLQNSIAEQMNRTIVELARAMIKSQDLPEYLWELAITHAAYIRNQSYTRLLNLRTPYEIWHEKRPDVSNL
jgi:transposase InsO family protein